MKLQQLLLVSDKLWIESFAKSLEVKKATKGSEILKGLEKELPEDALIRKVYGDKNDKSKRAFNQQTSDIYKQFLVFLSVQFREYPNVLLAKLTSTLSKFDERSFYTQADVLERTFSDTENYEALAQLQHLLRDHYGAKITKKPLYWEQIKKLTQTTETLQKLYALEAYFNDNDLIRRKRTVDKSGPSPEEHYYFIEQFFDDDSSRIQVKARIFWLRFTKTNNFHGLTSKPAKATIAEVITVLNKKPYLHFGNPEVLHQYVVQYLGYTSVDTAEPKQFRAMFNDYYVRFDNDRLLTLYPRMYQSLITTQSHYYTVRAGFQFMDDPKPMDKETEKGLEEVIEKMQLIRNKGSFEDEKHRLFGLMGEATARACLFGNHRIKAVELLEMLLVSEQQSQTSLGAHAVYINLCHCFFWTKQWDKMLDTYEKYLRLVKVNGWFDEPSRKTLEFMQFISNIKLELIDYSSDQIKTKSEIIFGNDLKSFEKFVPYTLSFLKLD